MSPLECDRKLEEIIRELTLRIVVPRWTEFDTLWEVAIRVCERYQLGKSTQGTVAEQSPSSQPAGITSSEAPCAVDEPAQTHLPIAA